MSTKRLYHAIVAVVLVIGMVCVFAVSLYHYAHKDDSFAYAMCLESGFPEIIKHNDLYYCVKTIDGTDTVVRLSKILDYPYNYMDE